MINEYLGDDLILLTGAPGSKWSAVYRHLSKSIDINSTDKSPERTYSHPYTSDSNEVKFSNFIGAHQGAYWGPNNEFGDNFDFLHNCSKQYIYNQFVRPFKHFKGLKIIKSHFFAYNLPYLASCFPNATIVLCYRNDVDCFTWWHACGGWGITYPNYTWYENDNRMLDKIKEENYNILKFAADKDASFNTYSVGQLFDKFNLSKENVANTDEVLKFKIAFTKGVRPAHIHSL